MERIRLGEAVECLLDNFALRAFSGAELHLNMDKQEMTSYLKASYESRELVNEIATANQQLAKLKAATHTVDEWVASYMGTGYYSDISHLIRLRLQDMTNELEDKTNDCRMMMDNMTLTMQTLWNHFTRQDNMTNLQLSHINTDLARANTGLSQEMKKDSSQMRSIALVTMIFLPISTVASIFSTTFFSWDITDGSVVSSKIWILFAFAVGLTGIVVGAWYFATRDSGHPLA
ncbi:hypothetical protein MFIFM68171_02107 [Madurella fahalii]|uniref:Uncharacterized protein n=1 Tax=Madurella fahalii TaxID=1157608 RepID=A0ABQ0G2E1_9PEZI